MKTITREGIKRIIGPVSGSGGSRGAGGGDISLAGLASEAWVEENYISKAFFNRLFTIHSASGVIDPNDPDEEQTIDSIEALVGFWTEQYVSALGQNSGGGGGGGGGGVTLNQPLEAINNAGLSAPTTAGTMLVWYNGSWTYSPGARLQIGGITATGTVLVNSSVTANSFIKTGGTSNMFLKADGSVDTNTYASETWVSQNYVSIQFFETLFNAINAHGVKVNANSITGIDSIKAMFGLWTERYLSALGQNSGGGGGGCVTLNQPLSGINNAGMNAPGTAGSLLVWNGTTWTYSAAASIVATTATFYGNSYAAGFAVTNKDNTYVLLAGGGTKLLSELGGHTSVSYNGNVYSPSSGVVALGYLTTSVKVNSSTYSVNSSGLVDIGNVVTAVKIAGTLTPYSPTAGVVEIPAYPTIPTNVSAFTNDAGYVSTSVSLSDPHLVLASPSGSGGPASFRALVASDIPDLSSIYATSDTWRTVQCNGVSIGNNTLNLVAGTNVAISASNGTLTFSSTDTNTLNTAGAVQLGSTKLYLVGASSQTDGVQTYSNVNCYIGTDGCLYSGGSKVMTAASGYVPTTGGTMTGQLHINYENDVSASNTSGSLIIGESTKNIGIDGNEIQARTNNSASTLYIQDVGGELVIGASLTTFKGGIKCPEDLYQENNKYGIDMQNSDIIGVNGIRTADTATQYTEGYSFKRTNGNFDSIRALDGDLLFDQNNGANTRTVLHSGNCTSYNSGGLETLNLTTGELQSKAGSFAWSTYDVITQTYDYVGLQVGDSLDKWQITCENGNLYSRQNDTGGTSTNWTAWKAVSYSDTLNTAGAGATSSRIWLVGSSAYNTTYSTTYTVNGCYIDTDGYIYSGGAKVLTSGNAVPYSSRTAYNANSLYNIGVYPIAGGSNLPTGAQYGDLFCMPYRAGSGNTTPDYATQLFIPNGDDPSYPNSMWFRTAVSDSWNTWQRVIAMDNSSKIVNMGKVTIRTEASNNYVTFTTSNQNMTIDIGSATAIYGKLFQSTSDIRKKDIVNNIDLNISAIAQAPIFNFTWKDYPGTRPSIGTSAQYWEKVLPYSVSKDQDGYLAMDYGATALAAAVLTARKVSEHEQRIAELERENKVLWNMIATLKAS